MSSGSVIPAAPLLGNGVLFHRSPTSFVAAAAASGRFVAKATPFNGLAAEALLASPQQRNQHAPLSAPNSLASSGRSAASSATSSALTAPRSAAEPAWKQNLRQQCIQRVKAQRQSLQQKLRGMHAAAAKGAHSSHSLNADMGDAHLTAAAAQASAALANSLRDIIQEQYAEQRSSSRASSSASGSLAGASSSAGRALSASPPVAAASSSSPSFTTTAASVSSNPFGPDEVDEDPNELPSFTAAGDEFLSQDEFIDLMQQLEEEVRREIEPLHQQQPQQPQLQHPFWTSASASSSAAPLQLQPATSAAASSFGSSSAFGSSAGAATAAAESLYAQQLAAVYDADAAAQYEADMEALQEFEFAQQQAASSSASAAASAAAADSIAASLPCPVCNRCGCLSLVSGASGQMHVQCRSCGLLYSRAGSLADFRQQLSESFELHAGRCRALPKFVPLYQDAIGSASAAAASAPSPAAAGSGAGVPTVALSCEHCRTWWPLPLGANNHASPAAAAPAAAASFGAQGFGSQGHAPLQQQQQQQPHQQYFSSSQHSASSHDDGEGAMEM